MTVIPRTVEEAAALVRGGSHGILIHMPLADPPFRARPLRRRQGWVGRMMGRPANKHEQLFWLDWHGPALMLFFVRACMMLSAVYVVAVVAVAFMRAEWLAEHRCAPPPFRTTLPTPAHSQPASSAWVAALYLQHRLCHWC